MSNGRHASRSQGPRGFIIGASGAASACTGVILVPISLDELFRYSPWGDPGAGTAGLWLGVAALVLILVPLAGLLVVLAWRAARQYLAWRRGLAPAERAAVAVAEVVLMFGAERALRHHNHEMSAQLTASVMGEERDGAA
jgi:hypothetical protein